MQRTIHRRMQFLSNFVQSMNTQEKWMETKTENGPKSLLYHEFKPLAVDDLCLALNAFGKIFKLTIFMKHLNSKF